MMVLQIKVERLQKSMQIIEDHQLRCTKGAWYEDLRFVKKYLLLILSFAYCDSILYNYLIRKGSIMNSMGSKRNFEIIGALDEVIDFYTENHADTIIVPDGIGVVKAAQMLGYPIKERVTGVEIVQGLVEILNSKKKSLYLLGAKAEVLEKLVEKVKLNYSNIEIVGYQNGYI